MKKTKSRFVKIQIPIFIFFLMLFFAPLKAQVFEDILGHSGDYFNYKQFKSLFGRATTDVNKTIPLKLENGMLKGISSNEEIQSDAKEGAWKVVLTGWREVKGSVDGEIIIEHCPSAVLNFGSRMEYVFYSPEIPSTFFQEVENELTEIKEELLGEYDDMQVKWGREGDKIMITAVYSYAGGVDSDDIQERIVFLMNRCRDLIRESMLHIYEYKEEYFDQLLNKTYSSISKGEFETLVSAMDIKRFADNEPTGKEGSYKFTSDEVRNFEIVNNGNSLEFNYWDKVAYGIKEESKKVLFNKISSWVNENPMDDAEMKTEWYPGYEENILIKAVYRMNGKIEGSEIKDNFFEFKSNWSVGLYEKIENIMSDFKEDMKENKLSFLEKGIFLVLIDNELFKLEKTIDNVPEGYWNFNVENKYQYEIYNYGNNLWMTSWYKLPESLTQESINEIINSAQQFANKEAFSDKYKFIVRNYPGSDKNYIQLVASLEFPEPVEGIIVSDGYKKFVYDLAQETYEHIEDLVE